MPSVHALLVKEDHAIMSLLYHLLLMTIIINYQPHHAHHYPQNRTYPRISRNQKISLYPTYILRSRLISNLRILDYHHHTSISPQLSQVTIHRIVKLCQDLSQHSTDTLFLHQVWPETINQKQLARLHSS